jgi:hypothetical protein
MRTARVLFIQKLAGSIDDSSRKAEDSDVQLKKTLSGAYEAVYGFEINRVGWKCFEEFRRLNDSMETFIS